MISRLVGHRRCFRSGVCWFFGRVSSASSTAVSPAAGLSTTSVHGILSLFHKWLKHIPLLFSTLTYCAHQINLHIPCSPTIILSRHTQINQDLKQHSLPPPSSSPLDSSSLLPSRHHSTRPNANPAARAPSPAASSRHPQQQR